jgi:hypothetical protein
MWVAEGYSLELFVLFFQEKSTNENRVSYFERFTNMPIPNKIIFVFLAFPLMLSGQPDKNLIEKTKQYILKTYRIEESNPAHSSESDSISNMFAVSLGSYGTAKKTKHEIINLFELLYDNTTSLYEDSPDVRRMKTRHSMLFSIAALSCDSDKAATFLDYAKSSLYTGQCGMIEDLLENEYTGMLFLDLLVAYSNKENIKEKLESVGKYLGSASGKINESFLSEAQQLILCYKETGIKH